MSVRRLFSLRTRRSRRSWRSGAFILLADSSRNATVTTLFFETLSSSGLGHRPFTARIRPDFERLTKALPQITANSNV